MFKDGHELDPGVTLEFDVAIVGGGMAGITLAMSLRGEGRRICLLEGGGFDPEPSSQRLFGGEIAGRSYFELDRCRFRVFGGSSVRWGGWCRPLDPIDFTPRNWISRSGWPIEHDDLAPYYTRASQIVALETESFDMADWTDRIPPPPGIKPSTLEPAVIQHGRQVDFGEHWRSALGHAADLTVLLHANVTELLDDRSGERVDRLTVRTLRGRQFNVKAETFVLAAGGIENARLLLASRGRHSSGIGNESDLVGRCFMDHLHVSSGHVIPQGRQAIPPFFAHAIDQQGPGHGVLTPTEEALTASALPSCSISLAPAGSAMGVIPRLNWPPALMAASETTARRLHRNFPAADARVRQAVLAAWKAGRSAQLGRQARRSGVTDGPSVAIVDIRAEQVPNPASRITLSHSRDRLGVARPCLDWQLTSRDLDSITHWTRALDEVFRSSGYGRVVIRKDWERDVIGGPHHMGTTRMSELPECGIVDADCRVHTIENLYIAGSSVFATGGHANPSYSVLALTLRLADHLRKLMGGGMGAPELSFLRPH